MTLSFLVFGSSRLCILHLCVLGSHLCLLLLVQLCHTAVDTDHGDQQHDGDDQDDCRDGAGEEDAVVAVVAHGSGDEVLLHDIFQDHAQHQRGVIDVQNGEDVAEDQDACAED